MSQRTVSPSRYHRIAWIALVSLIGIVISGAAVRLTGSGLGCSDWPTCERNELVPANDFNAWVEFGNRMLTGAVSVAVAIAVLAARRHSPRRYDLMGWAWALVAGVGAQIVVGALTVRWHLVPGIVAVHFLISMGLVAGAVVLVERSAEVPDRIRSAGEDRALIRIVFGLTLAVLALGTVVTAAGPNAGDEDAERLELSIVAVTRVHSTVAWVLLGAVLWLVIRTRARSTPRGAERYPRLLAALLVAQGTVGYIQYATGIPPALVAVHVTLATVTMVVATRLLLTTSRASDRAPVPAADAVAA